MKSFVDAAGARWSIMLDALLLGDIRDEWKIDLADPAGWFAIETDEIALVRALSVICRAQIAQAKLGERDFARLLTGVVLEQAREAVLEAAADFFPPSRWSAIRSFCEQRNQARKQWETIAPMMAVLDEPGTPAAIREAVGQSLTEMIRQFAPTDLPSSTDRESVPGQEKIQPLRVFDSPDSSERTPGD